MKKRLACGLFAAMMIVSLAACNKSDKSNEAVKNMTAEECKEYITLGDYKNIEVDADKTSLEVTDAEIQAEIDAYLDSYAESKQITEGTVKDGDTINLDFSGLLDGVAFSGGTATDYTYTIGGGFIKDLDRGLVGLEIGKEYEIPCKFPEDYGKEELNGKDVIFVVTVNYVEEKILPEYNDEFVKKVTANEEDPSQVKNTTAEFEEYIQTYLADSKQQRFNNTVYSQMMTTILDSAEIKSLPEAEVNETLELIRENAEYEFSVYGSLYGIEDFESYVTQLAGYASMEDFEAGIKEDAELFVKEKMAVTIIADNEGITVSKEEIDAYANDLFAQTTYESLDELKKAYGESFERDVEFQILYEKVYDKIVELAKTK